MTEVPHVRLEAVTKRFGATVALDRVSVDIARGEIHGLVGENGAGKSTLGKILAGVLLPDEGTLIVAGETVSFRSPRDALDRGITTIAQELSLVPARTVIDNIFLGIEDHSGPLVRRGALRTRFEELVERSGIEVKGDTIVGSLPVAERQKVEILRAVARRCELVVMDEPTARLSSNEARHLYETVRALAAAGTTVVYISHFLEEVLALSDRITVMRDGVVVRSGPATQETHGSLIEGMIGRRLEAAFPERRVPEPSNPEVLVVEGLTRRGVFEDVSFSVRAGEIVVLAGLVGSGRSEIGRAVFGADRVTAGRVRLNGEVLRLVHPRTAIGAGMGMIPEARKEQGLLLGRTVRENITLPHLRLFSRGGIVSRRAETDIVTPIIRDVDIRAASAEAPMETLSGGNQQKTLFARWLVSRPRLLIADEPTRGVDVGAKRAIYELLAGLAAEGSGVLVISSEIEEVLGLAHRILVMRRGRLVAELEGSTATEESVVACAFGASGG